MKNEAAASLGRLNRGRKKTMSKAAIAQRRRAGRISARKRRKPRPRKPRVRDKTPAEIMSAAYEKLATETVPQEPCQPPEKDENKEKDNSLTETVPSVDSAFNERKHLLA
jgi:hypothetical protein